VLVREGRSAGLGKGEIRDSGEVGVEKLSTNEEAAPASEDANDLVRTGGVNGTGVDAVDKPSLLSDSAPGAITSCCVVPSKE
jgi:hypothetical protein